MNNHYSMIPSLATTSTMNQYCNPNNISKNEELNHGLSFSSLGSSSSSLFLWNGASGDDSFSSSSSNNKLDDSLLADEDYALLFPEKYHDGIRAEPSRRRKTHRRSNYSLIGNGGTMETASNTASCNNDVTPTIVMPKSKSEMRKKKTHRRSQYSFVGNDMSHTMMEHHTKS